MKHEKNELNDETLLCGAVFFKRRAEGLEIGILHFCGAALRE